MLLTVYVGVTICNWFILIGCGYNCVLVHIVMCVVLACMCMQCIIVVLLD